MKPGSVFVLTARSGDDLRALQEELSGSEAASLGDISRFTKDFTTMADVDSYLSFNFSSCLCLTAGILQKFPQRPGLKRTVVNVSSKCAVQPCSSWVLYCSGKAARHMMFKVLAQEEPDLRVLNYSPGPMDTAMLEEGRLRTVEVELWVAQEEINSNEGKFNQELALQKNFCCVINILKYKRKFDISITALPDLSYQRNAPADLASRCVTSWTKK
ncbi:sepiapterin reductase-like [Xyrichtys novacula]|uniref:Sepiapterin reductase-like n=1 Tax=Xyrichtys novacula TaxID=13765 RepID=A0AAV1GD20_XYRNO|nr:sepiapterin reductase-like [Xyrichtys novacula]